MAQKIFSNSKADTVIRITEANPTLYHYKIDSLDMHVAWSTLANDSIIVSGNGMLYRWNIPTTCSSTLNPLYCDSIVQLNTNNVSGSYTIKLTNKVPVFYSWNNIISVPDISQMPFSYALTVFPNPFSGETSLRTDKPMNDATVSVVNLFGQTVKQINNISGHVATLRRDDLSCGLYFIILTQNGKTLATQKLIVGD